MVLKGGVLENKRKMKQGKLEFFLEFFFWWKRKIGKTRGTCDRNHRLCFDIT
jgi:hypothetical protein